MSDLNGGAPQLEPGGIGQKPKTLVIRPAGASLVTLPDGQTMVEFEVSPFEAVTIAMTAEGKSALIQLLTGGIVLGSPGIPELPQGL